MVRASNHLQELARSGALRALQENRHQEDIESNYFVVSAEAAQESPDGFYIDKITVNEHIFYIYQKKM